MPKELVGAAIFGLASLTDWLDGYLARRRGQVTALGQMIDPIADKLLTSAAFISLVQLDLAPAWMVAVIIGRELAVTGLRSLASARGVGFAASPLGKIKMVSQVTAILLLILGQNGAQPFLWLGQVALWVVVVTALVSAVDYYRAFQADAGWPGRRSRTSRQRGSAAAQRLAQRRTFAFGCGRLARLALCGRRRRWWPDVGRGRRRVRRRVACSSSTPLLGLLEELALLELRR